VSNVSGRDLWHRRPCSSAAIYGQRIAVTWIPNGDFGSIDGGIFVGRVIVPFSFLKTVPGIGQTLALTIMLETGDVKLRVNGQGRRRSW